MSEYPQKFNSSQLSTEDKEILSAVKERRLVIDEYIKNNNIKDFTCPSCGYPTLAERGGFEICNVCGWEDDGQDDSDEDDILGGPNSSLSLTESRLLIGKKLKDLSENLNKKIITSPEKIFEGVDKMDKEIKSFVSDNKMFQVKKDDPIFEKYISLKSEVLNHLFEDR